MNWIKFFFGLIFTVLAEIINFIINLFIQRPLLSLFFSFMLWVNSLPLPEKNIFPENYVTRLGQNQKLNFNEEYLALTGSEQNKVILAFRGKELAAFDMKLDAKTNRLNGIFRIVKRNTNDPSENLDVTAEIPEERVLLKLYQVLSFGVKVPAKVDLKHARKLPTRERLKYLDDVTDVKVISAAYKQFLKHLADKKTDVFFDKFGDKYDNETYKGFYAHNSITRNMMFFRENPNAAGGYSLHAYMNLTPPKSDRLDKSHEIF